MTDTRDAWAKRLSVPKDRFGEFRAIWETLPQAARTVKPSPEDGSRCVACKRRIEINCARIGINCDGHCGKSPTAKFQSKIIVAWTERRKHHGSYGGAVKEASAIVSEDGRCLAWAKRLGIAPSHMTAFALMWASSLEETTRSTPLLPEDNKRCTGCKQKILLLTYSKNRHSGGVRAGTCEHGCNKGTFHIINAWEDKKAGMGRSINNEEDAAPLSKNAPEPPVVVNNEGEPAVKEKERDGVIWTVSAPTALPEDDEIVKCAKISSTSGEHCGKAVAGPAEDYDGGRFCSKRCCLAEAERLKQLDKVVSDMSVETTTNEKPTKAVVKSKNVGLGDLLAACEKRTVVEVSASETTPSLDGEAASETTTETIDEETLGTEKEKQGWLELARSLVGDTSSPRFEPRTLSKVAHDFARLATPKRLKDAAWRYVKAKLLIRSIKGKFNAKNRGKPGASVERTTVVLGLTGDVEILALPAEGGDTHQHGKQPRHGSSPPAAAVVRGVRQHGRATTTPGSQRRQRAATVSPSGAWQSNNQQQQQPNQGGYSNYYDNGQQQQQYGGGGYYQEDAAYINNNNHPPPTMTRLDEAPGEEADLMAQAIRESAAEFEREATEREAFYEVQRRDIVAAQTPATPRPGELAEDEEAALQRALAESAASYEDEQANDAQAFSSGFYQYDDGHFNMSTLDDANDAAALSSSPASSYSAYNGQHMVDNFGGAADLSVATPSWIPPIACVTPPAASMQHHLYLPEANNDHVVVEQQGGAPSFESFFVSLGLGHCLPMLRAEEVDDFETLTMLSEDDLKTMGLLVGARRKLLNALHGRAR